MFRHTKASKYFCGLDIGSSKIKAALIHAEEGGQVSLLGVCAQTTHGFKQGSISSLSEFAECIHDVLGALSQKTETKIHNVQIGLNGDFVSMRNVDAVIPLIDRGSKIIVQRDVNRVNEQARLLGIKIQEEILHEIPQYYIVDDVNRAVNPLGLYGRKLGVRSLLVVANESRTRNIINAVNQAGYEVGCVHYTSHVCADVLLSDEDKKRGCALVDIGADVTSIIFFKDRIIHSIKIINEGSDKITQSLAHGLQLTYGLAEEIKKSYAGALKVDHEHQEEILVKKDNAYAPIKKERIFQTIEPLIAGFVERLKEEIATSPMINQIDKGVVITGGGALLSGLIERIEREINVPVKLGKINISAKENIVNGALYAAVVGLANVGYNQSAKRVRLMQPNGPWSKQLMHRVVELYHEYF